MLKLINRSLRIKFSLIIALVLLFIFTIASFVLIEQSRKFQKESLIDSSNSFAKFTTKPLGDAYNLYHNSGIHKLNDVFRDTLQINNNVPRIQVISVNGDVLYDTNTIDDTETILNNARQVTIVDPALLKAVVSSTPTKVKNDRGDIIELIVPYSDNFGSRPYSLRYFISYDSINANINQAMRTTLILNVFLFLVTLAAVTILVNRSILSPLTKITMLAKALGQGDFDYQLIINTGDELEQLANEYHHMAQNLKDERASIVAEKNTLSLVLTNIADGVIALDASCMVIFLNDAATQILGINKEAAIRNDIDRQFVFKEKDQSVTLKQLCQISDTQILSHKLNFITHDDKQKAVRIIVAPLKHPASNISYIVTFYDLTKEEEFEKMKLDFVSMAAHELRTPITSIRGYLTMLHEQITSKLTPDQDKYLQRSLLSTDQLNILVQNLLSISHIEGGMELQLASIDFEKMLASIVDNLQPHAQQQHIQLTFEIPDHPIPLVRADEFRITEVVTNFITNAINYNHQNGWVKVNLTEKDNTVVVSVSDGGVGIEDSALPRLFTKFYRVSTPLHMGSKGTGLGLYISKNIIDAHHGKIWVESELNKGSTFKFSLPAVQRTF